jgi:hypothetical protein
MLRNILTVGFLLAAGSCLFSACDIKDNTAQPTQSFTKIYENGDFSKAYFPSDIKQTPDSGFVILGTVPSEDSNFYGVYLMKIDKSGKFQWEHTSETFVNPVSEIMINASGQLQFFCMDKTRLGTHLVNIAQTPSSIAYIGADTLRYPLAAGAVQGGFLLETLDAEYKNTRLSKLSTGGGIQWTKKFSIYEDVEEKLNKHLTRQARPYPFFVGETGTGSYFFNGFNNFTLALTFTDANGKQTGITNGVRYESGISSAVPIAGNKLAASRYKGDGENVLLPNTSISATSVSAAKDLTGNELPELTKYARVVIKKATISSKNVVLYGTDTKNGQIVIFAYDEASGTLLGSRYLGVSNAFELGGFALTQDGGMVVAGKTYVAGRFPRICVFKLNPEDVNQLVRQ